MARPNKKMKFDERERFQRTILPHLRITKKARGARREIKRTTALLIFYCPDGEQRSVLLTNTPLRISLDEHYTQIAAAGVPKRLQSRRLHTAGKYMVGEDDWEPHGWGQFFTVSTDVNKPVFFRIGVGPLPEDWLEDVGSYLDAL
ncbi:hypothetical protein BDZ89DRAFT_1141418 [Hymenopellis radicata]|nr:hypothetical protein BDZ89DRAFT_1141418 [Hymenopellis radicata]